ncbi:Gfo/Idh/MocA family protein [Maribacter sp. 2307ULW6-5]|uniref:Gfo/Idh/MocA family protein n=1 Tax=Maribacter sp. 2307ULW6-5 TaxID=3386275 RepID=UPI0039BD687B
MKQYTVKNPLRWGMIGCGKVTEVKSAPAYGLVPGFERYGVMARSLDRAKAYAQRHGWPFFTDRADELINHPEIDAVYIATPPDSHLRYALMVAEAGKPCCLEKPMAPTYAESLEIHTAFERRNVPLFVAYYRRSLPRFLQIREWLQEGRIGTVRHISWHKARSASPEDRSGAPNWRTDAQVAPGGYFDDLASHGLDLFTFLLGDMEAAVGLATNQQGLYTAHDAVTGSWIHKSGATGSGSWVFGADAAQDRVTIIGDKGQIHFSVLEEKPIELCTATHQESLTIAHPEHVHQYHVAQMDGHLRGGETHPSTGATALHTSWAMDRILGKNV